jgi:hypothetical protein
MLKRKTLIERSKSVFSITEKKGLRDESSLIKHNVAFVKMTGTPVVFDFSSHDSDGYVSIYKL